MSLQNNLTNWSIGNANLLIDYFPITSQPILVITIFLIITLYIVSTKLRRFANPNSPKLSQAIREFTEVIYLVSLFLLLTLLFYLLIIFTLGFFAFSLVDSLKAEGFIGLLEITWIEMWRAMYDILMPLIIGSIVGLTVGLYLKYFQIPEYESGEGLDDVNDIANSFNKLNGFDPTKYIDIKKGCFFGASIDKKLLYVPWQKIRETHIQVLGSTGCGKGMIMTSIAYQSILAGETLIWFDPKFDRFSPRILADAAKKAKKDFFLINLNPNQPPQLNPLAGANSYEIEELLVTAFDLKGKGTDGDFHRGKDEDAAIQASKIAIDKNALSIPELIKSCSGVEEIRAQENFWRKLTKLGDLNAIKTKFGLSLEDAILSGSVIYIIGSTDNERVKMLQKLLLVRVNQIIKKKDRFKQNPPTCIILDEFKHLLSVTALTGLGVIRDFNAHCLLAHQSLGDLDSCAGITRAEAEGAVLDNTAIKIIYRIGDSDYAEKLSKNSGKKRVFVEHAGKGLDKNNQQQGSWKESNLPLIDTDIFTHLPMPSDRKGQASVGVLLGVGVSKLFFTGHLSTITQMPVVRMAPEFNAQSNTDGGLDDII